MVATGRVLESEGSGQLSSLSRPPLTTEACDPTCGASLPDGSQSLCSTWVCWGARRRAEPSTQGDQPADGAVPRPCLGI